MAALEDEIVLCFECGAKNRLKPGWSGTPVCGKCHQQLPAQLREERHQNGAISNNSTSARAHKPTIIIVGLALVIGYFAWDNAQFSPSTQRSYSLPPSAASVDFPSAPHSKQQSNVLISPTGSADFLQRPIMKPISAVPGILFVSNGAEPVAPFEIKTSKGNDYFIKLVDANTNQDIVGIYAIGGQTLEVDVPLGRYQMRYALGRIWYGTEHLFGGDTTYARSNKILSFVRQANQISGYTIELISQVNGNLETHAIGADQF